MFTLKLELAGGFKDAVGPMTSEVLMATLNDGMVVLAPTLSSSAPKRCRGPHSRPSSISPMRIRRVMTYFQLY